jgi:hypothetical protein
VITRIYVTMLPPQFLNVNGGSTIVAVLEDQMIGLTFVVVCTTKRLFVSCVLV